MSHQREAVTKMMKVRVGALFMEDGTGRTRTVIELVKRRAPNISNVVWFCPFSIQKHIRNEIEKHCGYVGDFWNIISMESMSSSLQQIVSVFNLIKESSYVIVDESHCIKMPHTKRSNRIIRASAKAYYRLILSGTPITQGIQDLYMQFHFLSDKILGYHSYYAFQINHLEYSGSNPQKFIQAHNMEYLAAKIEPYVYQKTRSECCELPEKIHTEYYFKMTNEQKKYYQEVKRDILENFEATDYTILLLFIRLQQILSGFFKQNGKEIPFQENPRLETLKDLLPSLPKNAKIVIWTKFKYDIDAIQTILPPDETTIISTNIKHEEREHRIADFQKQKRFCVLNKKMGKYSIDLTCVDIMIFYSNSFSYTDRLNAENLCRGTGQKKKILYINLICAHSIDERIQLSLSRKQHTALSLQEQMKTVKRLSDRRKWMNEL